MSSRRRTWWGALLLVICGCGDPLVGLLSNGDPVVRQEACVHLAAYPNPDVKVVAALARCLSDEDDEVRRLAAQALGKLSRDGVPALPFLSQAMDDVRLEVRIAAALAMLQIDPTLVEPRSKILLQIQAGDHRVIRAVGDLGPAAKWAVPAIKKLVAGGEPLRSLARATLGRVQPSTQTTTPPSPH